MVDVLYKNKDICICLEIMWSVLWDVLKVIYLYSYSPVNRTRSPQGFSLNQILQKLNSLQYKTCTFYKRKTYKLNLKVSPFGIAVIKKWQIKLRDAGTIDRFSLAFQYQINFVIKNNGQKKLQIKNTK